MAKNDKCPITSGIRFLQANQIEFVPHLYPYQDHGGTSHAAICLNVPEHFVIKTLVMEVLQNDGKKSPILILMHGDREVSTKKLARDLNCKTIEPASQTNVEKYTGYQPGGVSPFGTKAKIPIYVEATIIALETIYINAGKRGLLVSISPTILTKILLAQEVNVAFVPNKD